MSYKHTHALEFVQIVYVLSYKHGILDGFVHLADEFHESERSQRSLLRVPAGSRSRASCQQLMLVLLLLRAGAVTRLTPLLAGGHCRLRTVARGVESMASRRDHPPTGDASIASVCPGWQLIALPTGCWRSERLPLVMIQRGLAFAPSHTVVGSALRAGEPNRAGDRGILLHQERGVPVNGTTLARLLTRGRRR